MIKKYTTCRDTGDRLSEKPAEPSVSNRLHQSCAEISSNIEYQTIMGFGGAFTEAAAYTLSRMSSEKRAEVLKKYYDSEKGIGYSLGRVHINSCDFSLGNYSYVDDNDPDLESFSIEHDRELIIPLIRDAATTNGSPIRILASPWSPPAWMKSNNDMSHGGKLLPHYYGAWAEYYVRFIREYENEGVLIWGLSVQNEPAAVQTWDSCIYTAGEERDFIKNHLGPALHRSGYSDRKLLIWDHNRDIMVGRVKTVLDDPEAAKYIWGTGFHWYGSEVFENVGKVHALFPEKHLLFTEGCQEGGVKTGEWFTGERYARNMIGDFNNWCEGYLDWNIVLDETGGPNHVGNLCDAPIICDTRTDELICNSSYYYIGHFSKFIKPGAKRLFSSCDADSIGIAAFKNPDGGIIIVILNEEETDEELSIKIDDNFINTRLKPHSITTYSAD